MGKTPLLKRALSCLLAVILVVGLMPTTTAFAEEEGRGEVSTREWRGFVDVQPGDWFATDDILGYAVDNGLLAGYGNGLFGPCDNVSRAQVAMILWRVAGEPVADAEDFYDVDYSQWYGAAIEWARTSGVVSGYGDTNTFGPDDSVTREQLAVMLANYANEVAELDATSDCTALDAIAGADGVSSWARTQMGWAVDKGILSGSIVDGVAWVDPQGTAQRCQAAKMVSVFHRDVLGAGNVIDYADGVKLVGEPAAVGGDGTSAVIPEEQAKDVSPGDVVLTAQTFEHPSGLAIKVESVERQGGNVVVTGRQPDTIREVYDDYDVTETLTVDASTFRPASGATLMDASELPGASARAEDNPDLIAINLSDIGEVGGITLEGFVTVLPTFTVDVDVAEWKFYAGAKGPAQVNATISGNIAEERIPLGTGVAMGDDNTGASVGLFLVVSADGSLHIEQSYQFNVGIGTNADKDSYFNASDPVVDASVSAKVGPSLEAKVSAAGFSICDLGVNGGVRVDADVQFHENLTCVDTLATIYMGATYKVIGDFSFPGSDGEDVVFDETNSPVRIAAHWENGVLVPECTWEEQAESPNEGTGDDLDYIPVYEDNGYGTMPVFDNKTEYGNVLAEPFNVFGGTKVTLGFSEDLKCGYSASPGTVFRYTYTTSSGVTRSFLEVESGGGGMMDADCTCTIEVYCGRMTIRSVTGNPGTPVVVSEGARWPYPLHISHESLTLKVGEQFQLSAWNDFEDMGASFLHAEPPYEYHWSATNNRGPVIDIDRGTGTIVAKNPGTATVTLRISGVNMYERTCEVTVL